MIDDARLAVSIYNNCNGVEDFIKKSLLRTDYTPEQLRLVFYVLQVARWEDGL